MPRPLRFILKASVEDSLLNKLPPSNEGIKVESPALEDLAEPTFSAIVSEQKAQL
jgi:hypothetical protein